VDSSAIGTKVTMFFLRPSHKGR